MLGGRREDGLTVAFKDHFHLFFYHRQLFTMLKALILLHLLQLLQPLLLLLHNDHIQSVSLTLKLLNIYLSFCFLDISLHFLNSPWRLQLTHIILAHNLLLHHIDPHRRIIKRWIKWCIRQIRILIYQKLLWLLGWAPFSANGFFSFKNLWWRIFVLIKSIIVKDTLDLRSNFA